MSLAQELVGTWELTDWEITYADGRRPTLPFGADPRGLLVYGADGWMNASIARAQRARIESDSMRHAPPEQCVAAFESFFSYGGSWEVRNGQVVHRVTISLNPNFMGSVQVREVQLSGDRLTLSAADTMPGTGVGRLHTLAWRRPARPATD